MDWLYPHWLVAVSTAPRSVLAALLIVSLPTFSFQAWLFLPLAMLGQIALRLSGLVTLRATLFGLGVGIFTASKIIEFLVH